MKKSSSKKVIETKAVEIDEAKLDKIDKEIKENRTKKKNKVKEAKEQKYRKILTNTIIAIIVVLYFGLLILGQEKIPYEEYTTDLRTFSYFFLIVAILIFERSYKKDSFGYALVRN